MSNPNDKQPNSIQTLAELRAKAFEIIDAAKAAERLRRQAAKDEVRDIKRRTNAKLSSQRRSLLRDHQRRETELKLEIGSAMLKQIAEHGLENACLTPAELKSWSADAYSELLVHIWATKELEAEHSAPRKKRAPKVAKIEANASKPDGPVDGNSSESGKTH
jgi:ATP-dependent Clp protease ATP-binding subunit ClpA